MFPLVAIDYFFGPAWYRVRPEAAGARQETFESDHHVALESAAATGAAPPTRDANKTALAHAGRNEHASSTTLQAGKCFASWSSVCRTQDEPALALAVKTCVESQMQRDPPSPDTSSTQRRRKFERSITLVNQDLTTIFICFARLTFTAFFACCCLYPVRHIERYSTQAL